MSVPTGSAALNSTERRAERANKSLLPQRQSYLEQLALRREATAIREQTAYGLVMGWMLTLVAGFLFFCVPSQVDWLWATCMALGVLHLVAAVIVPQSLAWPQRIWMTIARWQGWLVMNVLLTVIYFALIWPASFFDRKRIRGFLQWEHQPPAEPTAWLPIEATGEIAENAASHYRSLPLLLASLIAFFFRRGNYLLIPIIILMVVLGLILYFVQSSALAPFIYTLF
jgi:hypothetical protein